MGRPSRLFESRTPDQIVCHVDMDCFYAACERLREPPLCGEPVVVGMGYEPGTDSGAVATASYEAREFGVESAQAISQALDVLPRKIDAAQSEDLDVSEAGFYRPVDMEYYESVSRDVSGVLEEWAPVVRTVSIDEAYLDVTDRTEWEDIVAYASELKADIEATAGVTASIGVAPTMSAAKVASDHDKPDGLVVVEPGTVADFFAPLDVCAVHGVGPVTAEELRERGIETAGDLASGDPSRLAEWFGERGRRIYRFASGEDERTVQPQGKPKSFSRESAFSEATTEKDRQYDRLETLARGVGQRARSRDVLYQTVGIKVVTPPFDVQTRARTLPGPVADEALLCRESGELFEEFAGEQIRKLGVRVSNLLFTDETQSQLEDWADDGEPSDATQETVHRDTHQEQRSLSEFE